MPVFAVPSFRGLFRSEPLQRRSIRVFGVVFGVMLVASVAAISLRPLHAHAATWTVCKEGYCRYTSIQAAVNAEPDGSTITVAPGTYDESVTVYKSLTIYGAGYSQLPWERTNSPLVTGVSGRAAFTLRAPSITIAGFTIGPDTAAEGYSGIAASDYSDISITHNVFQNLDTAVDALSTFSIQIEGNQFRGGSDGVRIRSAYYPHVGATEPNRFEGLTGTALSLIDSHEAVVQTLPTLETGTPPVIAPTPEPTPIQPASTNEPPIVTSSTAGSAATTQPSSREVATLATNTPLSTAQSTIARLPNTGELHLVVALALMALGSLVCFAALWWHTFKAESKRK